jgi:hypothetical protein
MNGRFDNDPTLIGKYRDRFLEMIKFVEQNCPYGFRKTKTSTTTPRVRFEALAIGAYLALQQNHKLLAKGPDVPVSDWLDSPAFSKVTTSDGANVVSKLRGRINFVRDRLLK